MKKIHFHSSDDRFCGARDTNRRFTTDADRVTCQACKDRDGFVISADGLAFLQSLKEG